MEILWWLAPAVVATLAAALWVSWWGRPGRGRIDREVAVQRMGRALERERPQRRVVPQRPRERSRGVALRPSDAGGSTSRPQ